METGKKRLEFYGGAGISLLPFVIFIITIIITTFVWGSISDGALWVPAFLALLIPFFLSKDKKQYSPVLFREREYLLKPAVDSCFLERRRTQLSELCEAGVGVFRAEPCGFAQPRRQLVEEPAGFDGADGRKLPLRRVKSPVHVRIIAICNAHSAVPHLLLDYRVVKAQNVAVRPDYCEHISYI